ncbi:CapA family protein [Streptococcus ferus]|uniref:Capsule biosynthesis protein n=1 Tax=Streptococcus ferus TaxID=1345 RepID=A0A2X3XZJ2_9STRE|nr:CapA family protein [Streptococcus ferus]SQF40571.1 capsule biosynthesis protein [Streptococcus ferus]
MLKKSSFENLVLFCIALIVLCLLAAGIFDVFTSRKQSGASSNQTHTARVMANGDILYHDILYTSARQEDGSYDFNPYFEYAKDWISKADLAIGDFEGTISPDFPLAGYPLFNAPAEAAQSMKDTGYDVVDLAHNHILDSQLSGALNTAKTFNDLGLDTIGVYRKDRAKEGILIKKVNGIKIAILGYAYAYNGMESNLTTEEYEAHLSDLDEKKIKADLKKAEQEADITIVMPQMGVEYQLEPTAEQVKLYHKMVNWGADVIFGGHPHVVEPSETLKKDGQKKFIIYSMGNFLSNQTYERMDNKWTERGLLMDLTFEKKAGQTTIKTVKAHPTLVWSWGKGQVGAEGYEYMNYRTLILEDFIEGGKYRDKLDDTMKAKADAAYQEMTELVNLKW